VDNGRDYAHEQERKNALKPEFCCLAVTERCMLRCKACYKWQEDINGVNVKPGDYPSLAQYKDFITGLRGLVDEKFIINFGGGEALLAEWVLELVDFSVQKGFWTNIASNGWLINEDMAKRIGASGLNEINILLDSIKEQTHDSLRGVAGVYSRVMAAIEYLSKYCGSIKIGISCIVCDGNLEEILPLVEWVNNNPKLNGIYLVAVMQPNNTPFVQEWWKGKYSFLWPKDSARACALLEEIILLKKRGYRVGNSIPQLEAYKRYFQFPDRFVKTNKCNLARAVSVSALGDIYLCFRQGILSNIKNGADIKQLWYSEESGGIREKISLCQDNCHFLLNCFFEEE